MMKKILMLLSVLVVGLFLVGCAEEISDEELEAELSALSAEELEMVIEEAEAGEGKAMAGLATRGIVSSEITRVSSDRLLRYSYERKANPCGNNVCDLDLYETKFTCPQDCAPGCTDTDGGDKPFKKGTIEGFYSFDMVGLYFAVKDDITKIHEQKIAKSKKTDVCALMQGPSPGTPSFVDECSSSNCVLYEFNCGMYNPIDVEKKLGLYIGLETVYELKYSIEYCSFGCKNGACCKDDACLQPQVAVATEPVLIKTR